MELLVTLRKEKYLEKINKLCDGIIVGSDFGSGFHYSHEDLKRINHYCLTNGLKFYVMIDNFICEDDLKKISEYLKFLSELKLDGLYFHDLGIWRLARQFNLGNKLIYDGYTVLCNGLEASYFICFCLNGVVISRELTYPEIEKIVRDNKGKIDMQIFGHLRLSYSKRKFLRNYFKQIGKDYNYFGKESLYLIEEKRDYKMPIVEDEFGTKIYSDYIYQMYHELPKLKNDLNRGIVDTLFIDDERIVDVLRDYQNINEENADELLNNLKRNYPDNYSSAYLYEKTNITKDE